MSYFAPYIDASGLHIPAYIDIENLLISNAQTIFGADIYLGNDSQDFQEIAARAQLIYDTLLTAQMVYNARSPLLATGADLDGLIPLNGLIRESATYSTATVTLTGTAFTVITSGIVGDINGKLWNLPSSINLGAGGSVSVTATCQVSGAITALASQINIIVTPTAGWTGVTNPGAAAPGLPTEVDSALRARQQISVANPSQALTTGILGSVLAVSGVSGAQLYENDTSAPVSYINGVYNPSGYPANSISVVADGGADADVANAIAVRKTPGCYTNGSTSVVTYDSFGVPTTIRFTRPTPQTVIITATLTPLIGYSSAVTANITTSIVNYINSLAGGQSVIISEIWAAILSNTVPGAPTFSLSSVTAYVTGSPGTIDLPMDFDQQAETTSGSVSVTVL